MKALARFVLAAFVLTAAPLQAAERYGDRVPVRLRLSNEAVNMTVRCQIVLAHFVTLADYRIVPGASRELELQREESSGALIVSRDDGRPMAIESIYCGLDGRWDETRADLPLNGLRDRARDHVDMICVDSGSPVCGELR